MSVSVELEQLASTIGDRTALPFLLTSGDDGRPHTVAVALRWEGDTLVSGCGRTTGRNADARPKVSLLWPPDELGGYSLIVDADAAVEGDGADRAIRLSPTHAVLHRPAANPDPATGHPHDCQPVLD